MELQNNSFRLCALCTLLLSLVSSVLSHFNYPTAIAYEAASKGEKYAEFDDDPTEWANMKSVLKSHKLRKLGSLCVTGPFILYARPDFIAWNEKEIRILSGSDSCTPPGMALSIQPASAFDNPKNSSIVLFRGKILTERGFPVARNTSNLIRKMGGRVGSMIITGKDSWTLHSSKGSKYCLKAKDPSSICLLLTLFTTKMESDHIFDTVEKGCEPSAKPIVLSNCIKFGTGKLEKIGTAKRPDGKKNETKEDDKKVEDDKDKDEDVGPNPDSPFKDCNNEELIKLLDFRIHNDFTNDYQMSFPTFPNKHLAWRTELLDTAFDITMAACPSDATNTEFLQIIRELYVYLAEKVWAGGKAWPPSKTQEVKTMNDMADHCLETLRDMNSLGHLRESVLSVIANMPTPGYQPYLHYNTNFEEIKEASTIMEVVWMIYNHVAALCHITFDFQSNFWPDFSTMFYDMYLDPMKAHWVKPGKFQTYMQVILGGYNITQELQGLAICVTDVFSTIPTLEILPRPDELSSNNVE